MSDDDDRIERMETALSQLAAWVKAYPLDALPKPDDAYLRHAHEALIANDISMDALIGMSVRHIIEQVGAIVEEALS